MDFGVDPSLLLDGRLGIIFKKNLVSAKARINAFDVGDTPCDGIFVLFEHVDETFLLLILKVFGNDNGKFVGSFQESIFKMWRKFFELKFWKFLFGWFDFFDFFDFFNKKFLRRER